MLSPEDAAPVSVEAFSAGLSALGAPPRFAVAVSGGRDSMALMRLSAQYARTREAEFVALTVDHGLRDGSSDEAEKVAAWCNAAGVAHRLLIWEGEKPSSGVQEAARAARYRLLAQAACEENCAAVLTAHSLNDQAETFLMRLARGSGLRGLSAMAPETKIAAGAGAPVRLLRPLLGFSRAQLTATVGAFGQEFIDDPSNDDPAFERIRMRALLAGLEENGLLTNAALANSARRLRAASKSARRVEGRLFLAWGGCFYNWGGASLDRLQQNAPGGEGLCRRLIHAVSGEAHAPEEKAAFDTVMRAHKDGAATLGGALVKKWKGRLWFLREPAALLGRAGVAPMAPRALDGPVLWDGRFILKPLGGSDGSSIAPLGADAEENPLFPGPPEAAKASPGVYRDSLLISAPLIPSMPSGGVAVETLTKERFLGEIIRFS